VINELQGPLELYLGIPFPPLCEAVLGIVRNKVLFGPAVALLSQPQRRSWVLRLSVAWLQSQVGSSSTRPPAGSALLTPARRFTRERKGKEGRGRAEGKESPRTVASPAAPAVETADEPALTHGACSWGYHRVTLLNRRASLVDRVLSQQSSGARQ